MSYAIIRYGEIGIKSNPVRKKMTQLLIKNIKKQAKPEKIEIKNSRIIMENGELEKLKKISGIVSYSPAQRYETLEEIVNNIEPRENVKTFKVNTQRVNKQHEKTSTQINKELGAMIQQKTKWKVKLKKPQLTIGVEILDAYYVYYETKKGMGGLPINPKNNFTITLKTETDKKNALLMMKRGLQPQALENSDEKLIKQIQEYTPYKIRIVEKHGDVIVTSGGIREMQELKKRTNALILNPTQFLNKETIKHLNKENL